MANKGEQVRVPLKLQVLLSPAFRSESGVAQVVAALQRLGLEPTASGRTSISARVSPETFERLFGFVPDGKAGPSDAELPVPEELSQSVQSMTLAPPHILFRGGEGERK